MKTFKILCLVLLIIMLNAELFCLDLTGSNSIQRNSFDHQVPAKTFSRGYFSDHQTEKIYKILKVDGDISLNVHNTNGSINISGWKKDYIEVSAVKETHKRSRELEKVEIVFSENNGFTIVTKNLDDDTDVIVNYIIRIPRNVNMGDIFTDRGQVIITNIFVDNKELAKKK